MGKSTKNRGSTKAATVENHDEMPVVAGRVETRIDAAHPLATERGEAQAAAAAAAEAELAANPAAQFDDDSPARLIQHVRLQAEQLSVHLRAQQRELDQREAYLNAREAQIEQNMRHARLWVSEHQAELRERQLAFESHQIKLESDREKLDAQLHSLQTEQQGIDALQRGLEAEREQLTRGSTLENAQLEQREVELQQQREELVRKQTAWQAAQEQFAQRQQAVEALQQMLTQREFELQRREQEVAEQAAEFNQTSPAIIQAATEYQTRKFQLDEAEGLLTDALNELDSSRQKLLQDRRSADEQARTERRRLADEQRAAELELARKRETLQRRTEQLDTRQAALDQMRADLTRLHRETLEMRLAVEETWAQLSGLAAPAAVTQTLSRIRARLTERYRLENEELQFQREQLESLATKVNEQHEKLTQQKKDFQQWVLRQQQEIEQAAAHLAAREQDVHQDKLRCEELQQKWQSERRHYQREIRRLLAELRHTDTVGV